MPTKTFDPKIRPIDKIIVHCSDSPDDRTNINAAEIDRWHKARNFKCIGYHFVILKDGTVELGRPLDKVGAHCEGFNLFSIGICWIGRHDLNPTQRLALIFLVNRLRSQFAIPISQVFGHCEFNSQKSCPNIDMIQFRKDLSK